MDDRYSDNGIYFPDDRIFKKKPIQINDAFCKFQNAAQVKPFISR
jgi:hypothetical protein